MTSAAISSYLVRTLQRQTDHVPSSIAAATVCYRIVFLWSRGQGTRRSPEIGKMQWPTRARTGFEDIGAYETVDDASASWLTDFRLFGIAFQGGTHEPERTSSRKTDDNHPHKESARLPTYRLLPQTLCVIHAKEVSPVFGIAFAG
ncbi:hypothetical protein SCP_0607450 [Sparassis crispa]|uniref:Uncharacterized protein n=1 Tax=Sparassis crispa TaxID=139825 RepID=A0A401GRC1_9APHY|nr:hypothetical protein SCP_0607450 [Sparassis crispa]GBE84765.1 hypothetical protein SCP_0607450 [Sparassis crispa]